MVKGDNLIGILFVLWEALSLKISKKKLKIHFRTIMFHISAACCGTVVYVRYRTVLLFTHQ